MTTHEVGVTREDNLWVADVRDLPSFVADLPGVEVDDIEIDYRFDVGVSS